uniref:Uncharacterized protein n=1 Tax=Aeromonas salmonicida subsp. salmonicida TaxID=29491 RepID=A0A1I9S1Z5_AERSS|nr:putative hypothetical protein [Aeromonas salmonicida subsp. salmonicida]
MLSTPSQKQKRGHWPRLFSRKIAVLQAGGSRLPLMAGFGAGIGRSPIKQSPVEARPERGYTLQPVLTHFPHPSHFVLTGNHPPSSSER